MSILNQWMRQEELVKSKVITKTESKVSVYQDIPLSDHVEEYTDYLKRRKKNLARINSTESRLLECIDGCDGIDFLI